MKAILMALTGLAKRVWNFTPNAWDLISASVSMPSATALSESPISYLFEMEKSGSDLTFMGPTSVCPCGSELWYVIAWFDQQQREIGGRFLEMACVSCGSICKSPTPLD